MEVDDELIHGAHEFVQQLVREVVGREGGLLLGAGAEPLGDSSEPCIFDWTALEVVAGLPDPVPGWPPGRAGRFEVVASQRGLEKIPAWREDVWGRCKARTDFDLHLSPAGWRMGGVIRDTQARRGDVLVVLGGGAGTEYLADQYMREEKPVIPIHAELGALSRDGNGGSMYLHEQALGDVGRFFRLRDGAGSAAARLSALRLTALSDPATVAGQTAALIDDLRPPRAFYVRLLARDHPEFDEVERFFREVVDPVVIQSGFKPHEVGRDEPLAAFLNLEIFRGLHTAGSVIVDLTGVRPNCMMELGYALARKRRVVISARKGTRLPFDSDKLPTHLWLDGGPGDARLAEYQGWFDGHLDMPDLVS